MSTKKLIYCDFCKEECEPINKDNYIMLVTHAIKDGSSCLYQGATILINVWHSNEQLKDLHICKKCFIADLKQWIDDNE